MSHVVPPRWTFLAAVCTLVLPTVAAASLIEFSGSGFTRADILPSVTGFRNALGTLNPNLSGSFNSGRREINWDGVPANFSAPNNLPADFFNVNSPRGVVFSTPGSGFQVSGNSADPGSPPE